jgi:hypothetical protein
MINKLYFSIIEPGSVEPRIEFFADFLGKQIYRYCTDHSEADRLQKELQTLGGAKIEREGMFLYALVCDMDAALREIEQAEYGWTEVV